jgi:hypothetical protein
MTPAQLTSRHFVFAHFAAANGGLKASVEA